MINFRYHVVTLIAVFLALGLGILLGASFIDQNTVKALETAQGRLSARNDRLVDRVRGLEGERDALVKFSEIAAGYVIEGTLKDRVVLLISFESTDKASLESAAGALERAGAKIEASIQLSDNLDMANDTRREQVALSIGKDAADPSALRKALVDELSAALTGRSPGSLKRLAEGGLASQREVPGAGSVDLAAVPSQGATLVLVAGEQMTKPLVADVLVPVVQQASTQGAMCAITAGGDVEEGSLVDAVRSERGLKLITVDGIEESLGQTALVLGLRAASEGRYGHYGSGAGADAPIPEARPRS